LKIINIRNGGLAWHGGILGAIAGIVIFSVFSRVSFWKLIDIMSPSVMIGLAIGRWGCFFNGCCYGKPTDFFLGTVFPDIDNIPRHPAQIYESLFDLVIFYILNIINKKKKFDGQTFCYLIAFYSVARFVVEFFREWTSAISSVAGLNLAQLSSILMIIVSLFIGYRLSKRKTEKKYITEDEQDDEPEKISA
jgi:prolipoprotein diacylglyceryl transferase